MNVNRLEESQLIQLDAQLRSCSGRYVKIDISKNNPTQLEITAAVAGEVSNNIFDKKTGRC